MKLIEQKKSYRTKLLKRIMSGKPTVVQHTHGDYGLNSCDECDEEPSGMFWVWWDEGKDNGMQICVNCFNYLVQNSGNQPYANIPKEEGR